MEEKARHRGRRCGKCNLAGWAVLHTCGVCSTAQLAFRSCDTWSCGQAACGKTGSLKERTAVYRLVCSVFQDTCTLGASRNPIGLFPKHIALPCLHQNLIRLGYL